MHKIEEITKYKVGYSEFNTREDAQKQVDLFNGCKDSIHSALEILGTVQKDRFIPVIYTCPKNIKSYDVVDMKCASPFLIFLGKSISSSDMFSGKIDLGVWWKLVEWLDGYVTEQKFRHLYPQRIKKITECFEHILNQDCSSKSDAIKYMNFLIDQSCT